MMKGSESQPIKRRLQIIELITSTQMEEYQSSDIYMIVQDRSEHRSLKGLKFLKSESKEARYSPMDEIA
jgi:hypothetical protein